MKLLQALLIMCVGSSVAYSKELRVKVRGLTSTTGKMMVAVYDSEDSWLIEEKAVFSGAFPIENKDFEVVYNGVDPGQYSVAIYHDANNDGKLNFSFFPPGPIESVGFYGLSEMGFGRPSWDESKFSLNDDMEIEIKLINP